MVLISLAVFVLDVSARLWKLMRQLLISRLKLQKQSKMNAMLTLLKQCPSWIQQLLHSTPSLLLWDIYHIYQLAFQPNKYYIGLKLVLRLREYTMNTCICQSWILTVKVTRSEFCYTELFLWYYLYTVIFCDFWCTAFPPSLKISLFIQEQEWHLEKSCFLDTDINLIWSGLERDYSIMFLTHYASPACYFRVIQKFIS